VTWEPADVAIVVAAWFTDRLARLARWRRIDEGNLIVPGFSWTYTKRRDGFWYVGIFWAWRRGGDSRRGCSRWVLVGAKWDPTLMALTPEIMRPPRFR
jgi:hypothetical protein